MKCSASRYHIALFALFVCVGLISSDCNASVTEFNHFGQWQSSAGPFVTIGFGGYPENTYVTDQYLNLGITFTDGADIIDLDAGAFPQDGVGLYGAIDSITVEFDIPRLSVATYHPGSVRFELYFEEQLIYTSVGFLNGGVGFFGGVVSTLPFDKVRIFDPFGGVFIDDLFFGGPVPAPGALALLGLAALAGRSRRRRG